ARLFEDFCKPVGNPVLSQVPVKRIGGRCDGKGGPCIHIFFIRTEVSGSVLFSHNSRINSHGHAVAIPVHVWFWQLDYTKASPVKRTFLVDIGWAKTQ